MCIEWESDTLGLNVNIDTDHLKHNTTALHRTGAYYVSRQYSSADHAHAH